MLGLTKLGVANSIFNITKEINNLKLSGSFMKKENSYSLEQLKRDGEKYKPESFKDETLWPVVIDKIKEIDFDDICLKKKITHLTQAKTEPIAISNRAEETVNIRPIKEYEVYFPSFGKFLRTIGIK